MAPHCLLIPHVNICTVTVHTHINIVCFVWSNNANMDFSVTELKWTPTDRILNLETFYTNVKSQKLLTAIIKSYVKSQMVNRSHNIKLCLYIDRQMHF